MIERMDGMPEGTLGFRVGGEITPADYKDVLVPELRKVVDDGGRLRQLYLIEHLDKIDPAALWEDAKVGLDLGTHHHAAFERAAIVTDQEWLLRTIRVFGGMAPGELKAFPTAELAQATSWVAG
jgi:hypothetical protein